MSENNNRITTNFTIPWSYDEDRVEEILSILEETGDYRNIEIKRGLTASFLKTAVGYKGVKMRIAFSLGGGDGPIFEIPKKELLNCCKGLGKWKKSGEKSELEAMCEILQEELSDCVYDFTERQIYLISSIAVAALNHSSVYNENDDMNMSNTISELYYLAYYAVKEEIETMSKDYEAYLPDEDESLATITLMNDSRFGECICINDNKRVWDSALEVIGCNKTPLEVKRKMRDFGLLVTDYGNPYSCIIQTKFARDLGVRKIVKIPVNKVESYVKSVKQNIKAIREKEALEDGKRLEEEKAAQVKYKRDLLKIERSRLQQMEKEGFAKEKIEKAKHRIERYEAWLERNQ